MKGYPLIYSRTKYHDYVSPFLVMPTELTDVAVYADNIMFEVDQLNDIRRVVFSANNHLIYGICFITYLYYDRLSETNPHFAEKHSIERDYCFDYTKRKTSFFTGVAIPKSELKAGYIPDITMEELWDIYIRFLKEQWELDESEVRCIKLDDPVLNISEKKYSSDFIPAIEKIQNINVIKNYTGNEQDMIDYFCNKIINGEKCSFISDANSKTLCQRLKFTHAVVSESIVKSLAIQPKPQSINQPNLSSIKTEKTQTPQLSHVSSNLDQRRKELEEKRLENEKNGNHSSGGLARIALLLLITVVIIIIIKLLT